MEEFNSLDDFIKSMPKNLKTIPQKARHLYIELGKRSFYDPNYKYAIWEDDGYSVFEVKPYSNPNIIICKSLAKQYIDLLTKAGIRAEIAIDKYGTHQFVHFYDEHDSCYLADLTNDLKNIQFRCKTQYFYSQDNPSSKEIRDIDLLLGYITRERGYSNEYWYTLKDILQNTPGLSTRRKLEIVMEDLQKYGNIMAPGDTEIFYIYQKFIRYCLPNQSEISFQSTKSSTDLREKCLVTLDDKGKEGKIEYLLNPKTRLFERVQKERKATFPSAPSGVDER